MNNYTQPNIQPASSFAQNFGVKAVVYGPPGRGKTPMANTAPNPLLIFSEPGMLSMKSSNVPSAEAVTYEQLTNMFNWLFGSQEAARYDTWIFDSFSQIAEIVLTKELGRNKDGRKAYGEMYRKVLEWLNGLYYIRGKHVVILGKQMIDDKDNNKKKPYFPGQELNIKIPHLFDLVMQFDVHDVPGAGKVKALRTAESYDAVARDRSGTLAEFEPPNLTEVFNKIMRGIIL